MNENEDVSTVITKFVDVSLDKEGDLISFVINKKNFWLLCSQVKSKWMLLLMSSFKNMETFFMKTGLHVTLNCFTYHFQE